MKIDFNKMASEYKENKYCIVKNAISEKELRLLLLFYNTQKKHDVGSHMEVKLGNIDSNLHNFITSNIFRKISNIRVKVLSMASCSDMIDNRLTEKDSRIEWERLMIEVMSKYGGWSRFMQYGSSHKFHSHYDAVGEVMGILHLSQPLKDYSGGLYIYHPEKKHEVCVDNVISKKDLLLCDANYYRHRVDIEPITPVGRLTYFINFNPHNPIGARSYKP